MFSLFLSLGAPYQMITPEQWSESGSGVYTLFNNKILWTISSTFTRQKICSRMWPLWPNSWTDWHCALNSVCLIVQLTVSQVFCSEQLPFGLSRLRSSFCIFLAKDENLTTIQVMFGFLQTCTWLLLLWNFLCFDRIKSLSKNLPWQNDC